MHLEHFGYVRTFLRFRREIITQFFSSSICFFESFVIGVRTNVMVKKLSKDGTQVDKIPSPPPLKKINGKDSLCGVLPRSPIVIANFVSAKLKFGVLEGITWGKDMEWETECFDVTPISYAQLGLLRQFQRTEEDTYSNIRTLLKVLGRKVPPLKNIPNRYLYK